MTKKIEIENIFPTKWVTLGPDDIIIEIRIKDRLKGECKFRFNDWYRHFLSTIERAISGDVPKLTLMGCNFSLQWISNRNIKLFFEDEEKDCSVELPFSEFVSEIKKMTEQIVEIMDGRTEGVAEGG